MVLLVFDHRQRLGFRSRCLSAGGWLYGFLLKARPLSACFKSSLGPTGFSGSPSDIRISSSGVGTVSLLPQ